MLVVGHKDTLEVCEEQLSNTETRIAAVGIEKVRSELSDPAVRWLRVGGVAEAQGLQS